MACYNGNSVEDYQKYLTTPQWRFKAQQRAKIDGFRCCMCDCIGTQNNPLQAHHITYKNLFHEDIYKDLITLCSNCHKAVHKMMNRVTDEHGRKGWKDTLRVSNHVLDGFGAVELPD